MLPAPRYFNRVHAAQLLLALAVLSIAGWFVYDRYFKSDEERIRELIQSAADAAHERRPSGASRILAEDFRGPEGVDKDQVYAWLVSILVAQYRVVEVSLEPRPLKVAFTDPKNATVDLRARVRAQAEPGEDWDELPPRYGKSSGLPLRLILSKGGDGWRIETLQIRPDPENGKGSTP